MIRVKSEVAALEVFAEGARTVVSRRERKLELIHGVFGPRVKSLTLADHDDSDAAQL